MCCKYTRYIDLRSIEELYLLNVGLSLCAMTRLGLCIAAALRTVGIGALGARRDGTRFSTGHCGGCGWEVGEYSLSNEEREEGRVAGFKYSSKI